MFPITDLTFLYVTLCCNSQVFQLNNINIPEEILPFSKEAFMLWCFLVLPLTKEHRVNIGVHLWGLWPGAPFPGGRVCSLILLSSILSSLLMIVLVKVQLGKWHDTIYFNRNKKYRDLVLENGRVIWDVVVVFQLLSCIWLCNPIDCSMLGFPVLHYLLELFKLMSIELMMPSNHLILCHHRLLLLLILPRIRVFYSELALQIRWPKYWSFSISPSNKYLGLISLELTGLISLMSKGFSRVFSSTTAWKHQFFSTQPFLWSNSHIHTRLLEKPQLFLFCHQRDVFAF